MTTTPLIVEGFHGPGGWAEGRRILGLQERAVGMEWDAAACATATAAGHTVIRCDVSQYPTWPFKGRITGKVDSPPCQAWSRAGKGLGLVDQPLVHQAVEDLARGRDTRAGLRGACKDERSLLAAEPMRWHHDLRPEWIALEEVPDVLPLWKQYAAILRSWGYSVWCGILNAADYGVPQTRRRAILIASRVRDMAPPEPTHAQHAEDAGLFGPARARWVSMAEALGWGATDRPVPTVTAGGGKTGGAEPFPTQARAALEASRDQGRWVLKSRRDSDAWIASNGPRENRPIDEPAPTFTGEAHRWGWQRPATTVCTTDRIAPPGHRDRSPGGESQFASPDTVRITIAEASVLQSFAADHPWQGTKTKQFEQVGNAVPPLLAAHVLSAATGIPMPRTVEAAAA